MVLVLVVAVLGAAIAVVAGPERLARLRLRAVRLLVGAAALQLLAALLGQGHPVLHGLLVMLSVLAIALFLWGNRGVAGVPLVTAGLLLNGLVVLVNLGMPVSVAAAARAGLSPADLRLADDPFHEAAGPHTHLAVLGDGIPVALPWRPQVVSPGDVLVAAGVGLLLVSAGAPAAQKRVPRATIFDNESTTRGSYS